MLAIAAVLHIVHIIARLLTQQAMGLGTCHMEGIFAAGLIALHAGSVGRFRLLARVLEAEVADLKQSWD